jgi:hypothetical protein
MRQIMISAFLISTLVVNNATAQENNGAPKFLRVIPTDAVRFVTNHSNDGQASTMLFDNFDISTDVAKPTEPDVRMKSFTYVRQIESTMDSHVDQDFRGFVHRNGTASAVMIVHSGGKTTVVDLKQAIEDSKSNAVNSEKEPRNTASQLADESGFDCNKPDGESDDFYVRISSLVPKGQPLQTTVILLVDRVKGDDDSGALVVVDSIDSVVKAKMKK